MIESNLAIDGMFALTVLMMAGVTYVMRAGGYWLMGHLPLTDRIRKGLEALPGAIIVSTILPIILKGDAALALSLLVAIGIMLAIRKDFLAVFGAAAAAALLRAGGL